MCFIMLQVAVEVFGLVQQLLPSVAILNQKYAPPAFNPNQSTDSTTGNQPEQGLSACTTSNHYAVIECEHPYKPACVTHYKVGAYRETCMVVVVAPCYQMNVMMEPIAVMDNFMLGADAIAVWHMNI